MTAATTTLAATGWGPSAWGATTHYTTHTAITMSTTTWDQNQRAMEWSAQASQFFRQERYEDALNAYKTALQVYASSSIASSSSSSSSLLSSTSTSKGTGSPTSPELASAVLVTFNMASCWRNMGAIHRYMARYDMAIQHWKRAEQVYRECLRFVQTSAASPPARTPPPAAAPPLPHHEEEVVCLEAMIVETLQSRALLHFKYQNNARAAMECHQDVLTLLLPEPPRPKPGEARRVDGVRFCPLTREQHTDALMASLEALAVLYKATLGDLEEKGGLATFEQALHLLQEQPEEISVTRGAKIKASLVVILRNISDVYFERGLLDQAVDALQEALDRSVRLRTDAKDDDDDDNDDQSLSHMLDALEKLGLAHERLESYDKALSCYEKALLTRSQHWGNDHIDVAKSLVNVGRVMELQGNTEGSMDLYKAAHAIYSGQILSQDFEIEDEGAETILQLIPKMLDQQRYEDAIVYLNKCLEVAEAESKSKNNQGSSLDKSHIYFDLGQAYVGLQDYVSATICLVEAAKSDGAVSEQQVYALLQRIQCLQQKESRSSSMSSSHNSTALMRPESRSGSHGSNHVVDEEEETEATDLGVLSESDMNSELRDPMVGGSSEEGADPGLLDSKLAAKLRSSEPPREKLWDAKSKRVTTPLTQEMMSTTESKSDGTSKARSARVHSSASRQEGVGKEGPPRDQSRRGFLDTGDLSAIEPPLSSPESRTKAEHRSASGGLLVDSSAASEARISSSISSSQAKKEETSQLSPESLRSNFSRGLNGFRRRVHSPRRNADDKSTDSPRKLRSGKPIGSKFRRQRKGGFQSLHDDDEEEEHASYISHTTQSDDESEFDGPIRYVVVPSKSWESSISQVTLRFDEPSSSQENTHEWWWGVTAEGFGRWFPTSYVSQAVAAAEGFLSARSIHSKVQPSQTTGLQLGSESSSCEEGSREVADHPSHLGIADSRTQDAMHASHGQRLLGKKESPSKTTSDSSPSPFRNSDVSCSSSPRRCQDAKELSAEIARLTERLLQYRKEHGNSHAKVGTTLFTLAVLHSRNRGVGIAIESATEALRIQKANGNFGDAARSLNFLGDLYLHQKQYKSSLTYYEEALKLDKRHHGFYSDTTAKTLNCIGTVHSLQNEFLSAMESHQEALRILKECHGENLKHPLVAETLCMIGSVYYRERNSFSTIKDDTGDYTTFVEDGMLEVIGRAHEDRGSYRMAISFFEEKLHLLENDEHGAEESEEIATTLNSLGMLSVRAGLYVEAIEYYERALTLQLQLGCDQVHLATARVLTGAAQFQLGHWNKALKLLLDALGVLQVELGDEHETVAATLYHLGVVHAALCEFDSALESLKRALRIQRSLLGDDHPATLRTRREIGNLYSVYESEWDAAIEIFDDVLERQRNIHGERHPNIAETIHSIGCAYLRKHDYSRALRLLEECYYMRVEYLGWDHPLQAATLHEISKIHLRRDRASKAIQICDAVLGIWKESLGEDHIDIARAMATKGSCFVALGDLSEAMNMFRESTTKAEVALGPDHPCVADIHCQAGMMYLRKCQFEEARISIKKALDIYENSFLGDDHPNVQDAREKYERVQRDEMLYV